MKKTFLTLFALIAMSGSVMAGDKPVISVADVEALPGETVSFTVNLVDGKADTYTAMTLFAYFPTEGFTTTGNKTVANTWDALGSVGNIDSETGLATIPLASEDPIPGSAVEGLVTVSFTVADNVAFGEYEVTLKETMFEYNFSDKDYADDVTFKVNVVERHNVVLDELSTVAPTPATDVNVKVKRTIKANNWSTICLPFAIPASDMETAFGLGVLVKDFTGYTYDEDKDELTINFTSASSIEANHPYLIKVTDEISYEEGFTVENVNINPDEAIISFGYTTVSGKKNVYHPADFIGTYVADFNFYDAANSYPLFLNGNKFYYATESTKHMKAFRGFFDFDDYLSCVENNGARISMVDDKTTGIKTVHGSGIKTEGYYDLQGRKIDNPKKGLYINNGKKVVIK